ncbi:MAG: dicarboxylate/amino acid:cation symporter [Parachlamydiales bacterium]
MCQHKPKNRFNFYLIGGLLLGVVTAYFQVPIINKVAEGVADVVICLLKLLSLPMIFLSITGTIASMDNFAAFRSLGKRVLWYATLTTLVAGLLGLALYKLINPSQYRPPIIAEGAAVATDGQSYLGFISTIVPSSFLDAFTGNHVIYVLLLAIVVGLAILFTPTRENRPVASLFSSLFSKVLKATMILVYLMPIGVWAFVTLFGRDLSEAMASGNTMHLKSLFLYVTCVVLSNLIQGLVVLPALVKVRGLSPIRLFRAVFTALTTAFFTRSSNAALPLTLKTIEENAGVSKRTANFSIPLCATINMNACAAFMVITVLYIGTVNGVHFSLLDSFMWVGIATLAAMGNAGVPMGCYFLSGALLSSINVPLTLLAMILPIYAIIDMLETALNVWSDICVTAVIDHDIQKAAEAKRLPAGGVLES